MGVTRELLPISEKVLAWVGHVRAEGGDVSADDLRRIELCALAVREYSMLYALYGEVDSGA